MITTLKSTVVILLTGILMAAPLGAQSPEGNWDNLAAIKPDQEIEIVTKDTKAYRGRFRSLTTESITARLVSGDKAFERLNVLRVAYKHSGRRAHHIKVGSAIGAAVGLLNGIFSDGCKSNGCKFAGVGVSALIGAAIGVALPAGVWEVVYRSP
jgi:hypothetical protein